MNKDIEYNMALPYTVEYRFVDNDPGYPSGYIYGGLVEFAIVKRVYLDIKHS